MADFPAYHRALADARAVGLSLTRAQAEAFVRLLEAHAEEIASRVSAGLARRGDRAALRVAAELIRELSRDLAISTRNGVTITANRVADIYAEATLAVLGEARPDLSLGTWFDGLGARTAASVLARTELAAAFRTIRRESVATVDRIIARALLRGATSPQLALELRAHVVGAEGLTPAELAARLGYEATPENLAFLRTEAGQVARRAELIARTEIMTAEHETHVWGAAGSPIVKALRWKLSTRHSHYDICDVLAEQDLYGLGPGLYDRRQVPARPHPRDICRTEDVLFEDPEEFGRGLGPVPARSRQVADVIEEYGLPPSQEAMLENALRVGETRFDQRRAA